MPTYRFGLAHGGFSVLTLGNEGGGGAGFSSCSRARVDNLSHHFAGNGPALG